jgi:hypothetical protein
MHTEELLKDFLTNYYKYRADHCVKQSEYTKLRAYSNLIYDIFLNIYKIIIKTNVGPITSHINDFMSVFSNHRNDYQYSDNYSNCFIRIKSTLNNRKIKNIISEHLNALDTIDLTLSEHKRKSIRKKQNNIKKLFASYYFRKRFIEMYFDNNSDIYRMLFNNPDIRILLQYENISIGTNDQNYICRIILNLDIEPFFRFVKTFKMYYEINECEFRDRDILEQSLKITNEGKQLISKINNIIANKSKGLVYIFEAINVNPYGDPNIYNTVRKYNCQNIEKISSNNKIYPMHIIESNDVDKSRQYVERAIKEFVHTEEQGIFEMIGTELMKYIRSVLIGDESDGGNNLKIIYTGRCKYDEVHPDDDQRVFYIRFVKTG